MIQRLLWELIPLGGRGRITEDGDDHGLQAGQGVRGCEGARLACSCALGVRLLAAAPSAGGRARMVGPPQRLLPVPVTPGLDLGFRVRP